MLVLAALCAALAALPSPVAARALPGAWFRERDEHPDHRLFSRQTTTPQVGSAEWRSKYPTGALRTADIPQPWLGALKSAVDAGLIPDIPPSTSPGVYPSVGGKRLDPAGSVVCSSSVQCETDQVYDVPDGVVAISFDDGPVPAGRALYKFLRDNSQKVTHFFIGQNILANPQIFLEAFNDNGNDIAVHTWSHPQMTILQRDGFGRVGMDNADYSRPDRWPTAHVLASLPHYVTWNDDTDDWKIEIGDQTVSGAKSALSKAYRGPKSPGLNILEHELAADCVKVFADTYPLIAQIGCTAKSIPDAMGTSWYLNAADNSSPVAERPVYGDRKGRFRPLLR